MPDRQTEVIDAQSDFRIGNVREDRARFDGKAAPLLDGKNLQGALTEGGLSARNAEMADHWRDTLGTFIIGVLEAGDDQSQKQYALSRLIEEMERRSLLEESTN